MFCRVRPLIPADASSPGVNSRSPTPEGDDKLKSGAEADISYPDTLDHREIVLSSSSENAMGQERRDEWAFMFDQVGSTRHL